MKVTVIKFLPPREVNTLKDVYNAGKFSKNVKTIPSGTVWKHLLFINSDSQEHPDDVHIWKKTFVKQENGMGHQVLVELTIKQLRDDEVGTTIENPVVIEDFQDEDDAI